MGILRWLFKFFLWFFGISLSKEEKILSNDSLTVIIPAYNEGDVLCQTLQAIFQQTRKADRIVIIDDGSEDNTSEVAKKYQVEVVILVPRSGSKAKAVNRTLSQLNIDTHYLAIIDADTVLAKNAFEKSLKHFKDSRVAAVCGYVIAGQTKSLWQKARFIEYLVGGAIEKAAQEWWGTPLIMAGCFTIWRRSIFIEVGGFPERSLTEDLDLTWTLIAKGYRVVYASEARCFTIDPLTFSQLRKQLLRWRQGYLQNLKYHLSECFFKPIFGFFAFKWLIDGIFLGPIFTIVLPLYLILNGRWLWLLILILIEWLYLGIVSVIQGYRLGYSLKILTYVPIYWALKPINFILFFEALVRQLNKWLTSKDKREEEWTKTREKGVVEMSYLPISGLPIGTILRFPVLVILTFALLALAGTGSIPYEGPLPDASIAFTFDDGWLSVYQKAFPIFSQCGAVGTVFVIVEQIGKEGFMSWQQLQDLQNNHWEIASHGMKHIMLVGLSDEELIREIKGSKDELTKKGFPVVSFAVPYGIYDERVIEIISQYYLAHRTIDPGINYKPFDVFKMKAYDVEKEKLNLDSIFKLIKQTKDTKGHLILVFHKIDEEGEYSFPAWKLEAICQYAKAQGFELFKIQKMK